MRRRTCILALLCTMACAATAFAAEPSTVVLYLVRHAEKADGGTDPELSAAGRARAAELARLLGEAGITHVLSTGYRRTQATARPIADALGLEVEPYDAGDPAAVAARLGELGGRILVVGHSDTTVALVAALGGEAGPPIAATEYDRLYVVTLVPGQAPLTVRLRFGARSGP